MKKETMDKIVLQLLKKVREKKEAIKAAKVRPQWKTSCTLSITGDSIQNKVNIQTIRCKNKLVEIYAALLNQEEVKQAASVFLGVEYKPVYQGYLLHQWASDLKTRVNMLKLEDQKNDLDALNKRIDKLITPEQRREMELVELQKILKD